MNQVLNFRRKRHLKEFEFSAFCALTTSHDIRDIDMQGFS